MRTSCGNDIAGSSETMENEFLKVKVESNGSISIYDKNTGMNCHNLNYFEDTEDCGDYWVYYPPYNNKTYTSKGFASCIWLEENGQLSATIGVETTMKVPACAMRPENAIRGESRRSD